MASQQRRVCIEQFSLSVNFIQVFGDSDLFFSGPKYITVFQTLILFQNATIDKVFLIIFTETEIAKQIIFKLILEICFALIGMCAQLKK